MGHLRMYCSYEGFNYIHSLLSKSNHAVFFMYITVVSIVPRRVLVHRWPKIDISSSSSSSSSFIMSISSSVLSELSESSSSLI